MLNNILKVPGVIKFDCMTSKLIETCNEFNNTLVNKKKLLIEFYTTLNKHSNSLIKTRH